METIKEGIKNSGRDWVGKQIKCKECKGVFRLQSQDKVKVVDTNDSYYYSIKCPTSRCGNYMIWYP